MRQLDPFISNFELYYRRLIEYVKSGKPCFSVRDRKEYTSWLEGDAIIMSGNERAKNSLYSKIVLKEVFGNIRNEPNVTTKTLAPYVGRERSPLLALMIASGTLIIK